MQGVPAPRGLGIRMLEQALAQARRGSRAISTAWPTSTASISPTRCRLSQPTLSNDELTPNITALAARHLCASGHQGLLGDGPDQPWPSASRSSSSRTSAGSSRHEHDPVSRGAQRPVLHRAGRAVRKRCRPSWCASTLPAARATRSPVRSEPQVAMSVEGEGPVLVVDGEAMTDRCSSPAIWTMSGRARRCARPTRTARWETMTWCRQMIERTAPAAAYLGCRAHPPKADAAALQRIGSVDLRARWEQIGAGEFVRGAAGRQPDQDPPGGREDRGATGRPAVADGRRSRSPILKAMRGWPAWCRSCRRHLPAGRAPRHGWSA